MTWSDIDISTFCKRLWPAWRSSHRYVWHLWLSLTICSIRIIGTWTHGLNLSWLSLFSDLKAFYSCVESNAIVILSWSNIKISTFCKRLWPAWRSSHRYVWHLWLSLTICSIRIIGTWTHGLNLSWLSLFSDLETFDSRIESNSVVILTWSNIKISTLGKRLWSAWRASHVYICNLWFGLTICPIWIVSTWTHGLNLSWLSFLSDLETFDSRIESNSVVILTWSNIKISTLGKRLWSAWRASHVYICNLWFGLTICPIWIVSTWTHCFDLSWLSFLSDLKAFYSCVESNAIIILTWSNIKISTLGKRLWSAWRASHVYICNLWFGLTICPIWIVSTWTHCFNLSWLSFLSDLKALHSCVEPNTIIILSRSNIDISTLGKRLWSARRSSHRYVRHLRLGLTICPIRIIGPWTHCLNMSWLSFLSDFKSFDSRIEPYSIVILTWSNIEISTLGEGLWSARRSSHRYVWHLRLCLTICSIRIIGTWTHSFYLSLFSLFSDLKTLHSCVEPDSIVILSWSNIGISTLGKRLWSARRNSHRYVRHLRLGLTICPIRIIGPWTHCLNMSWLSFLSDFKSFDSRIEPYSIVILTWSNIEISTLGEGLWSARRSSHRYVWHLWLGLTICSIRFVCSRTHSLDNPLWSLFTNSERLNIRIESLTIVILTWSHINVPLYLRATW